MLKPIAKDIWGHEADIKLPLGMRMPGRATIMRVNDDGGELAIYSPLPIDDDMGKKIDALGDVRYLIAPNMVHWMYLGGAKKRYPKAKVFGPPGLEKKLKGSVDFEALPSSGHIKEVGDTLRFVLVEGSPKMNEHLILHQPSGSLVVGDLLFNIHECDSFGMRIFLRFLSRAWKKPAQTSFWKFLTKDHSATARTIQDVLTWDFERVVVAHGRVIEDDAREVSRRCLTWMTSGGRKQLGSGTGSVIA
jgi:hypothetical protein